jgi:hypothetical protein
LVQRDSQNYHHPIHRFEFRFLVSVLASALVAVLLFLRNISVAEKRKQKQSVSENEYLKKHSQAEVTIVYISR